MTVPSGSDEEDASNSTVRGASPELGEAVKLAVGGMFGTGETWMIREVESVTPSSSVTVS